MIAIHTHTYIDIYFEVHTHASLHFRVIVHSAGVQGTTPFFISLPPYYGKPYIFCWIVLYLYVVQQHGLPWKCCTTRFLFPASYVLDTSLLCAAKAEINSTRYSARFLLRTSYFEVQFTAHRPEECFSRVCAANRTTSGSHASACCCCYNKHKTLP